MANGKTIGVAPTQSRQTEAHAVEEHWIVRRFCPNGPDDATNHLAMLMRLGKTGSLTFNLYRGGVGMVEFKENVTPQNKP